MPPSPPKKVENWAYLGIKGLLKSCLAISGTKVPEILIIPTPPFPGDVAIAAMVS